MQPDMWLFGHPAHCALGLFSSRLHAHLCHMTGAFHSSSRARRRESSDGEGRDGVCCERKVPQRLMSTLLLNVSYDPITFSVLSTLLERFQSRGGRPNEASRESSMYPYIKIESEAFDCLHASLVRAERCGRSRGPAYDEMSDVEKRQACTSPLVSKYHRRRWQWGGDAPSCCRQRPWGARRRCRCP